MNRINVYIPDAQTEAIINIIREEGSITRAVAIALKCLLDKKTLEEKDAYFYSGVVSDDTINKILSGVSLEEIAGAMLKKKKPSKKRSEKKINAREEGGGEELADILQG